MTTESRRLPASREPSAEDFRAFFDLVELPAALCDPQLRLRVANPAFTRFCFDHGLTVGQMMESIAHEPVPDDWGSREVEVELPQGGVAVLELTRPRLELIVQRHPSVEEVLRHFQRERLLDNVLRSNALFRLLSLEQREALSHDFQLRARPAGALLLEQGQPVDALYLVLQGQCSVTHRDAVHGERPLRTLREGDMFGEIALLLGLNATATVRADTSCLLLRLDHGSCERHLLEEPAVREALARMGQERLMRTAGLVSSSPDEPTGS